MNRRHSTKLPLQPDKHPRLFEIAYHTARAAGVLHDRITQDSAGNYNFVFNCGGRLITCTISREKLIASNNTPIIRAMALEIMGKVK